MQWGEIWTPGVHDTVVGGVILAVFLGALGLASAWVRNWRMRNPWVWLVSTLKEDAGLNVGAFLSGAFVLVSLTAMLLLDSQSHETAFQVVIAAFALFTAMFFWFSFFAKTIESNSTPSLFYKNKARPAQPVEVEKPSVQVPEKKALKPDELRVDEVKILKALHQAKVQPEGISVEDISRGCGVGTMNVILNLVRLTTDGLVEESISRTKRLYRLSAYGGEELNRNLQAATATDAPARPVPKGFEPSILQVRILHLFWGLSPNKSVSISAISSETTYAENEIAHALDGLCERELVMQVGASYILNAKGRSFYSERWGHPAAISKAP